jgi:DNA polymerase kappa
MMSPTPKGKEKEKESETPEIELTEAQRLKRSFERSLAGPSVGKAGLIRDQTGKSGFWRGC